MDKKNSEITDYTIKVYHGSQAIIETPRVNFGNPYNDYGRGFYCTQHKELAKEWACTEDKSGFANEYTLDLSGLKMLDLSGPTYNILNWLAILLDNRIFKISNIIASEGKAFILEGFLPEYKDFDVIKGYRADDSYFSFANAFLNNTISLAQLTEAMYLGELGTQIVLKDSKAFSRINYVAYEYAEKDVYYPKKMARDFAAREAYKDIRKKESLNDAVFLIDIMREEWKQDDPCLQRNISE